MLKFCRQMMTYSGLNENKFQVLHRFVMTATHLIVIIGSSVLFLHASDSAEGLFNFISSLTGYGLGLFGYWIFIWKGQQVEELCHELTDIIEKRTLCIKWRQSKQIFKFISLILKVMNSNIMIASRTNSIGWESLSVQCWLQ